MTVVNKAAQAEAVMLDKNRQFYNTLWGAARLVEPERFNTWPLVSSLLPGRARRLLYRVRAAVEQHRGSSLHRAAATRRASAWTRWRP